MEPPHTDLTVCLQSTQDGRRGREALSVGRAFVRGFEAKAGPGQRADGIVRGMLVHYFSDCYYILSDLSNRCLFRPFNTMPHP